MPSSGQDYEPCTWLFTLPGETWAVGNRLADGQGLRKNKVGTQATMKSGE